MRLIEWEKRYEAYARSGVKEHWIADPDARNIELFFLEASTYHSADLFSGEQTLPSQVVPEFPVQVKALFA